MTQTLNPLVTSFTILCVLLFVAPARAAVLDDFKTAVAAADADQGCASIPYEDYREQCTRKGADVERWCKTEPRKCEGLETKPLIDKISGMSDKIASLKQDRDKLNDQKSSASEEQRHDLEQQISDIEKQIYDMSKELDFTKTSLETDKSDADKRIYNGGNCVTARNDVQAVFKSASSKADGESEPEISPLAKRLIDYWDNGAKNHEVELQKAKDAIDYCQKCKSGEK
jgi:chromosome segregation ATPase